MTAENNIKLKAKFINASILDAFNKIISEVDTERNNGGVALLKHLRSNNDGLQERVI